MKNVFKKLTRYLKNTALLKFGPLFAHKVSCNICGWSGHRFADTGWHNKVQCPKCKSQVRQRIFYEAFWKHPNLNFAQVFNKKRILHFAPDVSLIKALKKVSNQYETADLLSEDITYDHIDHCIDISDMTKISDASVDCFLTFDVLEHVPDDRKAMREIKRVLKDDGVAFIMVPQSDVLKHTIEDPSIQDREKRIEMFGAPDHVRIYGQDFEQRLKEEGLHTFVIESEHFDQKTREHFVLDPPILSEHKFATNKRLLFLASKKDITSSPSQYLHSESTSVGL